MKPTLHEPLNAEEQQTQEERTVVLVTDEAWTSGISRTSNTLTKPGSPSLASTGNLSLVMRAVGHSSLQTAMIYQHPDLEMVRDVMNEHKTPGSLGHDSRRGDAA